MTGRVRRIVARIPGRLSAALVAALVLGPAAGRAEAQWGWGWGFGYNPENASITANYLNQRSLVAGQAAAASRPKSLTAPQFQVRDESFYDRYDPSTRMAMIDRVARDPAGEMSTAEVNSRPAPVLRATPAPAPRPQPVVHLANFFNASRQLVWPTEAPTAEDLISRRVASDRATLAVLDEYNRNGLASLATVTEARQKLLDYGRPALHYVREHSTPAIADSFHAFLLSLYAEVALAATVPKPAQP